MENKDISPAEQTLTEELSSAKSQKKTLTYITSAVILLIAVGLGYYFFGYNPEPKTPEEVISKQAGQFEKRLNELPQDATKEEKYSLYLRLARGDYLSGNYEEAKMWLDQFPEEDRNYQGVWYHYALIDQAQGNNSQALEEVKKAVEATPDNPQPWELYFDLIKDLPRDQQEAVYKEALVKTENDPKITTAYQVWQSQQ